MNAVARLSTPVRGQVYTLTHDVEADLLVLNDPTGLDVGSAPEASATIARLVEACRVGSASPISIGFDTGHGTAPWVLFFVATPGTIVLRSPLGVSVGGTQEGRFFVAALNGERQ